MPPSILSVRHMSRIIPGVVAMAAIVVASNVLVQFRFGDWLTWGAFTYPFAFLVTDIINRIHGARPARAVVYAGFGVGVVCSAIGTLITGEFGPLVTHRIVLGSGLAFLTAQLVDVSVFSRLRNRAWWHAPLASTLIGSTLDTILFFSIAFSATLMFLEPRNDVGWANEILPLLGLGPAAPLWVSLALADWMVKLGIALVALIPYRHLIKVVSARTA